MFYHWMLSISLSFCIYSYHIVTNMASDNMNNNKWAEFSDRGDQSETMYKIWKKYTGPVLQLHLQLHYSVMAQVWTKQKWKGNRRMEGIANNLSTNAQQCLNITTNSLPLYMLWQGVGTPLGATGWNAIKFELRNILLCVRALGRYTVFVLYTYCILRVKHAHIPFF
jgi:hypothetical protein